MRYTINKRLATLVLATTVALAQVNTIVYATNNFNINNFNDCF